MALPIGQEHVLQRFLEPNNIPNVSSFFVNHHEDEKPALVSWIRAKWGDAKNPLALASYVHHDKTPSASFSSTTAQAMSLATQEQKEAWYMVLWVLITLVIYGGWIQPLLVRSHKTRTKKSTLPPVGATCAELKRFYHGPRQSGDSDAADVWFWDRLRQLQQKYDEKHFGGVFEVSMPWECSSLLPLAEFRRYYCVGNVASVRHILEDSSSRLFLGGGATSADFLAAGESIHPRKSLQKATASAFSITSVRLLSRHVVDPIVQAWIMDREQQIASSSTLPSRDIYQEMKCLAAQIMMKALFDYNLSPQESQALVEQMETCRLESTASPVKSWKATSSSHGGKGSLPDLRAFLTKVLLDYRLQGRTRDKQQNGSNKDHLLIELMEQDKEHVGDKDRVEDMMASCFACINTTANTLARCLSELAQQPLEQESLRQDLMDADPSLLEQSLQNPNNASLSWESWSALEEARSCHSLQNAIRETLRLHPPTNESSLRVVVGDYDVSVVGTPQMIPAGSIVTIPLSALQRNTGVYGDNAHTFCPKRWNQHRSDEEKSFVAFSTGRRHYQEQPLVQATVEIVLARVLPRFQFQNPADPDGPVHSSESHDDNMLLLVQPVDRHQPRQSPRWLRLDPHEDLVTSDIADRGTMDGGDDDNEGFNFFQAVVDFFQLDNIQDSGDKGATTALLSNGV